MANSSPSSNNRQEYYIDLNVTLLGNTNTMKCLTKIRFLTSYTSYVSVANYPVWPAFGKGEEGSLHQPYGWPASGI